MNNPMMFVDPSGYELTSRFKQWWNYITRKSAYYITANGKIASGLDTEASGGVGYSPWDGISSSNVNGIGGRSAGGDGGGGAGIPGKPPERQNQSRINPYDDGPIVDQIVNWMISIENNKADYYFHDIVSPFMFKTPGNREPLDAEGIEEEVYYWIKNPESSPLLYKMYEISHVEYTNKNTLSLFIMPSDTRSSRGPRILYIESKNEDLIWDFYKKNFRDKNYYEKYFDFSDRTFIHFKLQKQKFQGYRSCNP